MDISFTKWFPGETLMDQDPTFSIHQKNYSQSFDSNGVDFNFQPFNISKSKFHEPAAVTENITTTVPSVFSSISNFSDQLISFQDSSKNLKDYSMIKLKDEELLSQENLNSNLFSISHNKLVLKTLKMSGKQEMRSPLQAQERVLAERNRREKLNQQFISLSAIIPGIKKMNKASVLEGTIRYLKELQEKEKKLVEQTKKKEIQSAVVSVKKSDNFNGCCHDGESLPDILVRVSDKNVLVRIHCPNQNGYIVKILREIEKLHLMVINSRIIPFGKYALDITVVAQMDVEFCMTVKDLAQNLRLAVSEFI